MASGIICQWSHPSMLLRREECSQTLVSPEARPLNERFSSIKIGNLAILIGALLLLTTLVEFVRWRRERRQQHVQRGKEDPEKQVNHGRDYSDHFLQYDAKTTYDPYHDYDFGEKQPQLIIVDVS